MQMSKGRGFGCALFLFHAIAARRLQHEKQPQVPCRDKQEFVETEE
jgi:hypothetical protein